jgi:CDP-diacylglycerol--glycerol-3-phosphate 3-phosphatidyltransferase
MSPQFNIATTLTWFRIAAIPLVALVFYLPVSWNHSGACLVFTLAGITDWLDGYLARRLNQTSAFGAFLDPVADKLMVTAALIVIVQADPRVFIAVTAAVIISREIAISALREWMAELGERGSVAVSGYGKVKTTLQMVGIGAMLWKHPYLGVPVYDIGMVLLIIAAGLTVWSMFGYLRAAWPVLTGHEEAS